MDKDIRTIQKGYLVDSAINKSLVETKGVKVIQSCESRSMSSKGTLVEKIKSFKKDNKHVFVVLHFESPQHFACLHVSPSTMVYYDSLKRRGRRPFNEYPTLKKLGKIEIHKPALYQEEVECGCMVVLRYWNLFYNKPYELKGEEARKQVLKYYSFDAFLKHLEANIPKQKEINARRIRILEQIIEKLDKEIKVPQGKQKLSYALSTEYTGKFDFNFYLTHCILRKENNILAFGNEHLFYENGRLKSYFLCKFEKDEAIHAAAEKVEGKALVKFWLNQNIITNNGKAFPLGEKIKFDEGYQGNEQLGQIYAENGERVLFGVKLNQFDDDLERLAKKKDMTLIELQNMLVVLMLMEHEVCHAIVGHYRENSDYGSEELAKPTDYPRSRIGRWGRKMKDSDCSTESCYTNKGGHGPLFCRLVNLLFGHWGIETTLTYQKKN